MTRSEMQQPHHWMDSAVRVTLVGAGGNGSECADILCNLHLAMLARGHEYGLHVEIYDPGVVREPNLVRQRFWPHELGDYKATALARRYNMLTGMDWQSHEDEWSPEHASAFDTDVLVTAVDLASVRTRAAKAGNELKRPLVWLDLGNDRRHGQAVLGHLGGRNPEQFPHVLDHYPEVASITDDPTKSCSTRESLESQDALINRAVATHGMSLLWQLLADGKTAINSVVIDLATGQSLSSFFPETAH